MQAAASLREEGFDGRITLIGDEAELPYHKPPLSKTFIKESAAKPQILRAEAFYSGACDRSRCSAKASKASTRRPSA